jgi:hypothetical protein
MAKPQVLTELDEAKRIVGMLKSVNDPREYMEIFNITIDDIKKYKSMIDESKKLFERPTFNNGE